MSQGRDKALFQRVLDRPIITTDDMPFRCAAVYNPAALMHDGHVVLLLRVEDRAGGSAIHTARSRNGVDGWRINAQPLMDYGDDSRPYETWGVEDPRVTWVQEHECWYICYTANSPKGPAVGMASTCDLEHTHRMPLALPPTNKDAVLLPRRCPDGDGGRWVMLHRPEAGSLEHIWSAYSPDLKHWGDVQCVLTEHDGPSWDAHKIGSGPPPILTDHGWLLLFHGSKLYGHRLVYRVGAALLNADNPQRVVKRHREWLLAPEADYEHEGLAPGVVFPSGLVRRGNELWMYYGAADTSVGLATVSLQDLLEQLR